MFLCQHLGMAPEEGVYLRDKMSDPAYKPPPPPHHTLSTSAKVAKRGVYMRDTRIFATFASFIMGTNSYVVQCTIADSLY